MLERGLIKRRKKQKRLKRRWRIIQSIGFLIILILTSFILLKSSFFNINEITVQGLNKLEEKEIINLAEIELGINILKVNLEEAGARVKLHPKVKEVELSRNFPNQIIIEVKEREPVAIIPYEDGFIEVDEEGVILARIENVSRINLPLLTGIEIKSRTLGTEVGDENIKAGIKFLKAMPDRLVKQLSEINVSNEHQVIIYTTSSTQIRLGSPERIKEKMTMLEKILKNSPSKDIEYIDISFDGQPVFKMRDDNEEN